ncbi:aldehyde dehydrogenase family protein [Variovorax sp. J22R133]|uniref:aldehyde dehydrogenase family protein n=1 Tax=Variovorax brevis TaxID=3053503 RepID=UPI00257674B0|nr:aldehyde dehydrogenase family protein [Variovorax sp. J22R133]MDM0113610.1 aldehyde dehydrogenase family protein [Variovorax sp. J22R133]
MTEPVNAMEAFAHDQVRHDFLDGRAKLLLIDGRLVPALSGRTFATINPSTGRVLAEVADASAADVDQAVTAARRAFEGPWSRFKPFDRQAVLLRLADLVDARFHDLALLDTLDMGAPVAGMGDKRRRVVAQLRHFAGLATSTHGQSIANSMTGVHVSYTTREPVGVVAAINACNCPLGLAIAKIAPALAAGCTVVLKPSEHAPLSPLLLGEWCLESGIPPGVVNVVMGFGAVGAALAAHPGVDKVAFTGSTEVGQQVIRASAGHMKRVSAELGGKSPNVVFADANVEEAVQGIALAVFANAGQASSAGTRLFVAREIHVEFVERLAAFTRSLKAGDPLDVKTQIGPLVSEAQLERIVGYLRIGKAEGARTVAGGARLSEGPLSKGYFVAPTVFAGVQDHMVLSREEISGPVLAVMAFDSVEHLMRRASDNRHAVGCGIWTRDIGNAHRVAKHLRTGTVWINCYRAVDPAVPSGGYNFGGYGRESGTGHMDEFLQGKSVWIKAR